MCASLTETHSDVSVSVGGLGRLTGPVMSEACVCARIVTGDEGGSEGRLRKSEKSVECACDASETPLR